MTAQEILAAIAASPALQALAAAKDWAGIAASLSANRKKVIPKIITARGIAAAFPGGPFAAEAALMKLEGARDAMLASNDAQTKVTGSLLKRQLAFLATEGLDFGDATLRSMIDLFATPQGGSVLTTTERDAFKAMAMVDDPVSEREVEAAVGLQPVSTWTGAITATEQRNGMVNVTITYTRNDGQTRQEQTFADDLTPGRVADIIARRVESLQKADAALALFGG